MRRIDEEEEEDDDDEDDDDDDDDDGDVANDDDDDDVGGRVRLGSVLGTPKLRILRRKLVHRLYLI